IEEGIVRRSRAVVVEPQNKTRQVIIIRLWPSKLIVGHRAELVVLQKAAPPIVAHQDVELSVRTEAENAPVVVPAQRLIGVGLISIQMDQIAIERQGCAVPNVAIDAVPE